MRRLWHRTAPKSVSLSGAGAAWHWDVALLPGALRAGGVGAAGGRYRCLSVGPGEGDTASIRALQDSTNGAMGPWDGGMATATCSEQRGEDTCPALETRAPCPSTSAPLYGGHEGGRGHPWDTHQPFQGGFRVLHVPFRAGGMWKMSAGAERVIQQSFPKLHPLWVPTPSTPKAMLPSALDIALART